MTLTWSDGHWTVHATRGGKVLVKPLPVRTARALQLVATLEVPEIDDVVEEVVETARNEAELEAERLRQELAQVEERLAELGS